MSERLAKVMWRVFQWAGENDIDMSFETELSPSVYPRQYNPKKRVLVFSKGGRRVSVNITLAIESGDLERYLESSWRHIVVELCAAPLSFENL